MSRFILLAALALGLCHPTAYSQTPLLAQIDSLKNELQQNLTQAQRAKIYGDLSWYYNTVSVDSALRYGNEALKIAQEIDDRQLIAQSLSDLGAIYFVKGEIDKSLELYGQSLNIREEDGDKEGMASLHFKIGGAYYRKLELEKSMSYFLKSLYYYEKTNNENVIANLHSNIAVVYTALHNYAKALDYLISAEAYFEQNKLDAQLANNTLSMGNVYSSLQDTVQAINHYKKTIEIAERAHHFITEATAYNNLGAIYTELGQHRRAIEYIQKALEIRTREKLDSDAASANITLAINYTKLGEFNRSKALLLNSLGHFEQTGYSEKTSTVYFQLIPAYAGLGKMDSVFHYMDRYTQNQSALLNDKVIEVSNELETKYQTEKKEQQIEILNQETAIQRLRLRQRGLFLLAALGVMLAGAVTFYFIFKQRKLTAEARLQQEINRQQERATRAVLDAEERERRRIASDLHDGVGQILSAALLNLNYMNKSVQVGELPDRQVVDNALQLVKDSYDEMRSISHQMMPNALLKAGLASSIKEFLDKIDSKQMKIDLDVVGLDERLDEQTETVLYRTIQESVNNVVKHARASKLTIQLVKDDEGISVTVEDNGKGFDTRSLDESKGIGLKNIRSRVALLNGSVEVDSSPGRGTLTAIHIPS